MKHNLLSTFRKTYLSLKTSTLQKIAPLSVIYRRQDRIMKRDFRLAPIDDIPLCGQRDRHTAIYEFRSHGFLFLAAYKKLAPKQLQGSYDLSPCKMLSIIMCHTYASDDSTVRTATCDRINALVTNSPLKASPYLLSATVPHRTVSPQYVQKIIEACIQLTEEFDLRPIDLEQFAELREKTDHSEPFSLDSSASDSQ